MENFSQLITPQLSILGAGYGAAIFVGVLVLTIWNLYWKACGLWRAARQESKPWFIVLLLINTVGILEIIYLYVISKKRTSKPAAAEPIKEESTPAA